MTYWKQGPQAANGVGPDLTQYEPVPDGAEDAIPTDGSTVSIRKPFVPLRTTRACDICKLRKVKCDGGKPCHACRLHNSSCIYSGTTRKQLVNRAGLAGLEGSSATMDLDCRYSLEVSSNDPEIESATSSRSIPLGPTSTSSSIMAEQVFRNKETLIDWSDTRRHLHRDFVGSSFRILPLQTAWPEMSSDAILARTLPAQLALIHREETESMLGPAQPDEERQRSEMLKQISSTIRNDTGSTLSNRPYSTITTENASDYPITRENDHRNPVSSGSTDGASETHRSWTVLRNEPDAFGNAGISVFQGSPASNLQYWGPTSYLAMQDVLARMLYTKASRRLDKHALPFIKTRGEPPAVPETSPWRWGCERYISHVEIEDDKDSAARLQPMFLSPHLAQRFLHAYSVIIHPIFPILRLEEVRQSVQDAYTFGKGDYMHEDRNSVQRASSLDRARDLLVLAFGAQVEGGDGDAHCHKEVARAWSRTLHQKAKGYLYSHKHNSSELDLVKIWIIFAAYSRSYGNTNEELCAINQAARLSVNFGLHREAIYRLSFAEEKGLRSTFWVCYHMEKWSSLCHGLPSHLVRTAELDSAAASPIEHRYRLAPLADLGHLMHQVELMYDGMSDISIHAGLAKAVELHDKILRFRSRLPHEFDDFANVEGSGSIDLDTDEGELAIIRFNMCGMYYQIKILALLPLLSLATWRAIRMEPLSFSPELEKLTQECVEAACEMIRSFQRYGLLFPHLPELSLSSILLLYALSVIYMDALRLGPENARRRYADLIVVAYNVLEHYDHPAARVADAMCQDISVNHFLVSDPRIWRDNTHGDNRP